MAFPSCSASSSSSSPSPSPSPRRFLPNSTTSALTSSLPRSPAASLPPPPPSCLSVSASSSSSSSSSSAAAATTATASAAASASDLHHMPRSFHRYFVHPLSSLNPNVLRSVGPAEQRLSSSKLWTSTADDHDVWNADESRCNKLSSFLVCDANGNNLLSDGKENLHKRMKRKPIVQDGELKLARISSQADKLGISTSSTIPSDGQKSFREEYCSQQDVLFTAPTHVPTQRLEGSHSTSNLFKEEHDPISCSKDTSSALNSASDEGLSLFTAVRSTVIDGDGKISLPTNASNKPAVQNSLSCSLKPPTYPRKGRSASQKSYQNLSAQRSCLTNTHSMSSLRNSNNVMHYIPTFKEPQCSLNTATVDGKVPNEGIESSSVHSSQRLSVNLYDVGQGSIRNTSILSRKCGNINSTVQLQRERLSRKSNLCPVAQKNEFVSNYSGISAPAGILGRLNPGIIRNIRTRKQVQSAIEAVIGSLSYSSSSASNLSIQNRKDRIQYAAEERLRNSDHEMEEDSAYSSGTMVFSINHLKADVGMNEMDKEKVLMHRSLEKRPPELLLETVEEKRHDEMYSQASSMDDHDVGWKDLVSDSSIVQESCDTRDLSSCWLELLRLDLKGRLSALKRSRRRVRDVIASSNFDPAVVSTKGVLIGLSSTDCRTEEMQKWKDFFLNMDGALCSEGARLEKWLSQVIEMQPFCAKKGFVLPQWDLATCRMGEALPNKMGSAAFMFLKATQVTG